ncbi:unnamed protein product [Lymnaea stagnalis]|uniref:SCP domain-containing protein n=1 Tax=Lymnaea stagnalis TaxID=6523 RepID=A0AAV2HW21_LYMST
MLSNVLLMLTICATGCAVVPEALSESDIAAFLSSHNQLRSSLSLPDLVWNSTLASVAEEHGSKCLWRHSFNRYGENLYAGSPKTTDNAEIANAAVALWATEVKKVDPKWACIFVSQGTCGHYSQLVWKNTKQVGCSVIHCTRSLENLVVCEYDPPGNYMGQTPY